VSPLLYYALSPYYEGKMMALDTVTEYISAARMLLQDRVEPYRYDTADLLFGLNTAILEARKVRPDLFSSSTPCAALQQFTTVDTTAVRMDQQYRMALVYYICAQAQLRDDEATQDARAGGFFGKFTASLLTLS